MKLECRTHGASKWKYTICCAVCSRVYQAVREGDQLVPLCPGAKQAPEVCECGATLPGKTGSARAICTECFISRVKERVN